MPFHGLPNAELGNLSPESSMQSNDTPPSTMPPIEFDEALGAVGQMQFSLEPPGSAELPGIQFNEASLRRFSFDDEILELEEDNWSGLEVQIPLAELLFLLTGRQDLQNVESLTMHIKANTVSLSGLSSFLPRLAFLDLGGRRLHSLRDLGGNLLHLTHLNVTDCGLTTLDGTKDFPGLQVLIADANKLQLVDPVADLLLLKHFSVRYNRISDLATLASLGKCPNLVQLELHGNPVTHSDLYRLMLQRTIGSLKLLDGESVWRVDREAGEEMSISSSASSLSGYEDYSAEARSQSLLPPESNLDLFMSLDDASTRPETKYGVETNGKEPSVQPQQKRVVSAFALPSASSERNKRRFPSAESASADSVVDGIRRGIRSISLGDTASKSFSSQQQ